MKFSVVFGVTGSFSLFVFRVASVDYDQQNDFCRRFYHQSAVIKDRLYVDGGFIGLPDNPSNYSNEKLLFHDLNNDRLKIPPLISNLTTKPASVPTVSGGQLWADEANGKLYLFGGEYPQGPPFQPSLWCYDTWNDTWARIETDDRGQLIQCPSFGAGTSVEHMGMGYYLGGWLGVNNVVGWSGDRFATSNLISYDMINNVFRNDTGPPGPARVEGGIYYVPTGDEGLLISFGGLYAEEGGIVGASMSDIDVYDVSAKTWNRVQASGDVPESRRLFCGGLTSAADDSSYNVYIYGGASTSSDSPGLDDIYILTMPSFNWVRFWVHDPPRIHNGFTCNVINKGQMMVLLNYAIHATADHHFSAHQEVLGGTFPFEPTGCDAPAAWGAHIMDLGRANPDGVEWYGYRKNLTTYSVPQDLISVIGGGPSGGAQRVAPDGGFNSSDIEVLFSRKLVVPTRQPTRVPKSNNGTTNTNSPSIALIVGPSVGLGVPVIAAMLGFYLIYSKKQARKDKSNKETRDHLGTEHIRAYQLPTTQSPVFSPGEPVNGYQYPIHPYAITQSQSHKGAFNPYLYQPPNLAKYSGSQELPQELGRTPPQELPTDRPSTPPEKLVGDKPITENDGVEDKLREIYGKNMFEDTSRLGRLPEITISDPLDRDYSSEERPLPSPDRRNYSKEGKPSDPMIKHDSKQKDSGVDAGQMPGNDTLGHMF